jgi:hypothetical protein
LENEFRRISHHNAARQVVHATIRKVLKVGGAFNNALDLIILVAGDAGTKPQITVEMLSSVCSTLSEDQFPFLKDLNTLKDWLTPPLST